MKYQILALSLLLLTFNTLLAQNVGIGTNTPDPSAALEVASDSSGILIPRLTAMQRDAIADPATGLLVFVTTDSVFYCFDGEAWRTLDHRARWITDVDKDTKIHAEASPDDDILRFSTAGVEYFLMDSGRLEVLNTGHSVFIGNGAGANDDLTYNSNTVVGDSALFLNTQHEQTKESSGVASDSCLSHCTPEWWPANSYSCGGLFTYTHIIEVSIGGTKHTSGCTPYSCYSHISIEMELGGSYYCRMEMAEIGNPRYFNYFYSVDWNEDGDFDDENETTRSSGFSSTRYYETFVISVPDSISPGMKRLRVGGFDLAGYDPDPCEFSVAPGEIEDYTLLISDPIASTHSMGTPSDPELSIYPNPAADRIYVAGVASAVNGEVSIYTLNGTTAYRQRRLLSDDMSIDISTLDQGYYLVELRTPDFSVRKKLVVVR